MASPGAYYFMEVDRLNMLPNALELKAQDLFLYHNRRKCLGSAICRITESLDRDLNVWKERHRNLKILAPSMKQAAFIDYEYKIPAVVKITFKRMKN
jgi:hypothetical protein